jgi:hypothetical protein
MYVVVVGHKRIFACTQSMKKDSYNIETWHHEWRKGYYQWMIGPNYTRRWYCDYLDTQQ